MRHARRNTPHATEDRGKKEEERPGGDWLDGRIGEVYWTRGDNSTWFGEGGRDGKGFLILQRLELR